MANFAVELAGCIQQFVDDATPPEQKVKQLRKALHPDTWEAFGKLPWGEAESPTVESQPSAETTESEGSENDDQSEQPSS